MNTYVNPSSRTSTQWTVERALAIMELSDVPGSASLKAKYKTLLKSHHPDRNPGERERAQERTRDVIEAYNFLRKRAPDHSRPSTRSDTKSVTPRGRLYQLIQCRDAGFFLPLEGIGRIIAPTGGLKRIGRGVYFEVDGTDYVAHALDGKRDTLVAPGYVIFFRAVMDSFVLLLPAGARFVSIERARRGELLRQTGGPGGYWLHHQGDRYFCPSVLIQAAAQTASSRRA